MSYKQLQPYYAEPTMTRLIMAPGTYRWMALDCWSPCGGLCHRHHTAVRVVNSLYLLSTIAELALVFVLSARGEYVRGAAEEVF